jgi:hypothetical protein
MEAELGEEKWKYIDGCQREWDTLPPPGPALIVGLDGGFIHAKEQKSRGAMPVMPHTLTSANYFAESPWSAEEPHYAIRKEK